MQGLDPGEVAMNAIVWLGGGAGGAMVLLACLVTAIFAALNWCSQQRILHCLYCSVGAWSIAFVFKTIIMWNVI